VFEGLVARDVLGGLADDDGQLDLVVNLAAPPGDGDRIEGIVSVLPALMNSTGVVGICELLSLACSR